VTIVGDIDEALERAEDELLGAAASAAPLADGLPLPGMGATVRARLLQHCEELQLQAGSILFRAGDAGDALYAVRSGRMSLRVARPGQLSLRLLAFGPGVIFGEMALLDGCARSADAVAELPTTLLVLRRDRFERLAADDAGLYTQVLHGLSLHLVHRLRDTTALLGERA
jgi:CRP-like cAMP-binding protein